MSKCSGWCPLCYEGVRCRASHKGHFGFRAPERRRRRTVVVSRTKNPPPAAGPGNGSQLRPGKWGREFPGLWEFLTAGKYDDGSARLPGTVLLCSGEGRVRLWLNNRDEGLTAWLSGETVEEVVKAADMALTTGNVEWRRAKGQG